jgi:hypothetical protein
MNSLSLPFTMSLYFAYRDEWPNVIFGSPGVWALVIKTPVSIR